MDNSVDAPIVSILTDFLGHPKSDHGFQLEYNCPTQKCIHDQNKFNLNYHTSKKVFKCWKCKYKGYVHSLVKRFGGNKNYKKLLELLPKENLEYTVQKKIIQNHNLITCDLPDGYKPLLKNSSNPSWSQARAMDYAFNERKLSFEDIDKYQVGYVDSGYYKNRLILVSKNRLGKINYFEARSFLKKVKPTYLKPSGDIVHKDQIIFNESEINWDLPVYLVEGVFDMLRIKNSIPMLGKMPSDLLIRQILKYKPQVVICLDADAIKDSLEIYQKMASLGVDVRIIDMFGKQDISKIYEDYGNEAIFHLLKTTKKLSFEDILLGML